jgi:hypothetical protein
MFRKFDSRSLFHKGFDDLSYIILRAASYLLAFIYNHLCLFLSITMHLSSTLCLCSIGPTPRRRYKSAISVCIRSWLLRAVNVAPLIRRCTDEQSHICLRVILCILCFIHLTNPNVNCTPRLRRGQLDPHSTLNYRRAVATGRGGVVWGCMGRAVIRRELML